MILAEGFDWVTLLSDKGLAVAIVVATMFAIWRAVAFTAPLAKDFVSSTCELHTCLKETSIKQTALLDDHSDKFDRQAEKLSDIRAALASNRCVMTQSDIRQLAADARDVAANARDAEANLRSHDANFPVHLPHGAT